MAYRMWPACWASFSVFPTEASHGFDHLLGMVAVGRLNQVPDVLKLGDDPACDVVLLDHGLHPLQPGMALDGIHEQGLVQGFGGGVDVEGVDGERPLSQFLMSTRIFRQYEHPAPAVDADAFLGHQV